MMNKTKMTWAVAVMLLVGKAHAGFHCANEQEAVVVEAVHGDIEESFFSTEKTLGNLNIQKMEEVLYEGEAEVSSLVTRVGKKHFYDLSEDAEVTFSVEENYEVVTFPGSCSPHGRVTCDYSFVTVYTGFLNIKGEQNVVLDCTNI